MLDRESTFALPGTVKLLQEDFIPVALDQAYQRRQKDTEGEFYRKIASQSPRNDFENTTQGFYVADASGKLYFYNNNRDPEKVQRLIRESLTEFLNSPPGKVAVLETETRDERWNVSPPEGGLVVRVRAKVLDGYEKAENRWKQIFQTSVSRDNLWITKDEHEALVAGTIPEKLQKRIARFHLVDNTRGEPPMWRSSDIRELSMNLTKEGAIEGRVVLRTVKGEERGYEAELKGKLEVAAGQVTKLEIVCLGQFWGEGRFTRGAPKGKFPLAITFTLADGSDIADRVPPQGSRGWIDGYLW